LDRDGTINEDVGHMNSLDKFALIPGAAAAIARLNRHGIPVFIITNQSGVARGLFTERFVGEVHRHLQALLAKERGFLNAIYYCPHHPDFVPCGCRKPAMGMIEKAVSEHPVDLSQSYIVGDKPIDMALAQGGAKGVLVQTGYGETSLQEMLHSGKKPDAVAKNLAKAVEWILNDMKERKLIDA
jgi:histidinol-phosphate phosphatase family protein